MSEQQADICLSNRCGRFALQLASRVAALTKDERVRRECHRLENHLRLALDGYEAKRRAQQRESKERFKEKFPERYREMNAAAQRRKRARRRELRERRDGRAA